MFEDFLHSSSVGDELDGPPGWLEGAIDEKGWVDVGATNVLDVEKGWVDVEKGWVDGGSLHFNLFCNRNGRSKLQPINIKLYQISTPNSRPNKAIVAQIPD